MMNFDTLSDYDLSKLREYDDVMFRIQDRKLRIQQIETKAKADVQQLNNEIASLIDMISPHQRKLAESRDKYLDNKKV